MADTPIDWTRARFGRPATVEWLRATPVLWGLALALVVLAGGTLRFHGLDWDQPEGAEAPLYMHPDERFIAFVANDMDWPSSVGGYFDTADSPLNPYNTGRDSFVYGTLPIFLGKAVSTIAGDDAAGPGNSYGRGENVTWGRRTTAFVSTLTIALVFALGTSLFGRAVGLGAAAFYALAVLPTQLAHFWAVDPYLTFFATAALVLSVRAVRARGGGAFAAWMLLAGLAVGLAAASKVSAFPVAIAPALAVAIRIGIRDLPALGLRWRGRVPSISGNVALDIAMLSFAAWIALATFRVAQPYAFEGPNLWDLGINAQWWDDLQRERELQSGDADYPPFVQFADRAPYLTPLKNIFLWGLGPAFGAAALGAIAVAGYLMVRRRELAFLIPLAFAAAMFLVFGGRFVVFMRYFEPLYPVFAVFAAWGVVSLWRAVQPEGGVGQWLQVRRWDWVEGWSLLARTTPWIARAGIVAVVAGTAWWALAFQSVYRDEHPRVAASEWIFENVPAGSAITMELWDDALPYRLPGEAATYQIVQTDPYRTDSLQKVQEFVYGQGGASERTGLDSANVLVISSNRVRESIPRLEREYPAMRRYYELLLSGELGFERVATFESRPNFLGISLNDSNAEESFSVYDHPEVWIFTKTEAWNPERAVALLNEAHPERAVNLRPGQGSTNGLQFTAEQAARQQAGGTFSAIVSEDGFFSRLPWLWWLLWLQIPAFAALSWTTWLLRSLPDRGYGLSKLLGFASVALPTWLLVAWGIADFSGSLVWGVFGGAVGAGLIVAALRRNALLTEAREGWRAWLVLEAVFLTFFFVFLAFRYWNPDLWHPFRGGEKPMELAYLTAVVRSTELPPIDPWFGGGSMNYYYMGWFFLAVPIRALRIVPEVAFNLAIPTYAGLVAIGAAGTVYNLVGLATRRGVSLARLHRPGGGALVAAALGAILLIGIGNLDGAHQLIERFQAVNEWSLLDGVPVLGGGVGVVGGLYRWLFEGAALPPFDWWRSSRVHFGQFDITEFPYWTFLFADLHPHLMAMPFFGAVMALAVGYLAAVGRGLGRQGWVLAGVMGLSVGLIRTVHTWDWPTALLILVGAVVIGQFLASGRGDRRFWRGAGHLAFAAAMVVLPFLPYAAHSEVFNAGIHRAEQTTQAQQYLAHFGVYLFVALAFVAVRCFEEFRERSGARQRNLVLATLAGPYELLSLTVFLAGLTLLTWPSGLTVIALSVVLEVYLLNLLWCEWRSGEPSLPRLVATGLFVLAVGIGAGVDVITINNDIVRMNTVFKFSLQAWQLFAIGSGYAIWYVGAALWRAEGFAISLRPGRGLAGVAWAAAVVLLLMGGSVFLFSGTPARQGERFADLPRTLNGLAYLEAAPYNETRGNAEPADDVPFLLGEDEPLIRWLRENVEGSPIIVEAVGPLYHWTARMTWNTGLPTVIGWDWHQKQQRWDYSHLVDERVRDTRRFYEDGDSLFAEAYLRKYNVRYVIVGTNERVFSTPEGLAKFDAMASLTEVFRSGEGVIYAVDQQLLVARVP